MKLLYGEKVKSIAVAGDSLAKEFLQESEPRVEMLFTGDLSSRVVKRQINLA